MKSEEQEQFEASLSLGRVRSRADAFAWWGENPRVTSGTTLVVSHKEASSLTVPIRRTFGKGLQLLSMFSESNITVLNDRIVSETANQGSSQVGVDYVIAFDTNAASFLRSLFCGRNHANIHDLRQFMEAFRGNRINWDVRPYLHENTDTLLAREREQEIYETVLASEQLSSLDVTAFLTRGELCTLESIEELRGRAGAELAKFVESCRTEGWSQLIAERRKPIYALVLYITSLERLYPGKRNALRKLKLLIEFMDVELSALFLAILWIAWCWFVSDPRAGIFGKLQPQGKFPLVEASNISWDLFHMVQQPELVLSSRRRADVLIPAFLTADQRLAQLWEVYPIRNCWARSLVTFPYCVPAVEVERELQLILGDDKTFISQFLSSDAYHRRKARLRSTGRPSLDQLIARLESQFCPK